MREGCAPMPRARRLGCVVPAPRPLRHGQPATRFARGGGYERPGRSTTSSAARSSRCSSAIRTMRACGWPTAARAGSRRRYLVAEKPAAARVLELEAELGGFEHAAVAAQTAQAAAEHELAGLRQRATGDDGLGRIGSGDDRAPPAREPRARGAPRGVPPCFAARLGDPGVVVDASGWVSLGPLVARRVDTAPPRRVSRVLGRCFGGAVRRAARRAGTRTAAARRCRRPLHLPPVVHDAEHGDRRTRAGAACPVAVRAAAASASRRRDRQRNQQHERGEADRDVGRSAMSTSSVSQCARAEIEQRVGQESAATRRRTRIARAAGGTRASLLMPVERRIGVTQSVSISRFRPVLPKTCSGLSRRGSRRGRRRSRTLQHEQPERRQARGPERSVLRTTARASCPTPAARSVVLGEVEARVEAGDLVARSR